MKNIQNLINRYLKTETQYAIQIKGAWGIGKTYYYKKVIEALISNTSTYSNSLKKYKPVYVSLFGLKSVEEVQAKIILELLQESLFFKKRLLSKKVFRISLGLSKLLFQGVLAMNRGGNLKDYISNMQHIANDVIDIQQLVICLDDLERISETFKSEDIIGLINNWVEEKTKIIIICNDDQIGDKTYKDFKEKVIGLTIVYSPNTKEVIQSIINLRYSSYIEFHTFLKEHLSLLEYVISKNKYNYRHLIYAMDCLFDIFSIINTEIIQPKEVLEKECSKRLDAISKFVLFTAIEFKSGKVSFSDRKSISRNFIISDFLSEDSDQNRFEEPVNEKEETKNLHEVFVGKYYTEERGYYFYDSVFAFVTGVNEFEIEVFKQEFVHAYNLRDGIIAPEYTLFNELHYNNCYNFTDAEYKEKTLRLVENAEQGKYKLIEYAAVLHHAERFNNILNFNSEELLEKLKKGMSIVAEKKFESDIDPNEDFHFDNISDSYSPDQKKLLEFGRNLYQEFKQKRNNELSNDVIVSFTNHFDIFDAKYKSDINYELFVSNTSFIKCIDGNTLVAALIEQPQINIIILTSFFKNRYKHHPKHYPEESGTLLSIKDELKKYIEHNTSKTIQRFLLQEFLSTLNAIESQFNNPYRLATFDV